MNYYRYETDIEGEISLIEVKSSGIRLFSMYWEKPQSQPYIEIDNLIQLTGYEIGRRFLNAILANVIDLHTARSAIILLENLGIVDGG